MVHVGFVELDAPNAVRRAQSPLSQSSAAARRCRDVSRGRKFGEHCHRGVPLALVVVARQVSNSHQEPAFLVHEATAVGLPTWAVGGRPVLGTPQDDLRAAIPPSRLRSHQKKVPLLLEWAPRVWWPPRGLPSLVVGHARSSSVSSLSWESRYRKVTSTCAAEVRTEVVPALMTARSSRRVRGVESTFGHRRAATAIRRPR
jgi:hypothetical protein